MRLHHLLALSLAFTVAGSLAASPPVASPTVRTNLGSLSASSPEPELGFLLPIDVNTPVVAPQLHLSPATSQALAEGELGAAIAGLMMLNVDNDPAASSSRSFLLAWCLVAAHRAPEAVSLLPALKRLDPALVPPEYRDLVIGQVLLAGGRPLEAEAILHAVPTDSLPGRAAMSARAEALIDTHRVDQALALWASLSQEPRPLDPITGRALQGTYEHGSTIQRAQAAMSLYTDHPQQAAELSIEPAAHTWQQAARRGTSLHRLGDHHGAVETLKPIYNHLDASTDEACAARWALGRSLYKRAKYAEASEAFGEGAARCVDTDVGPDIAYLHARAEQRRKWPRTAARRFQDMTRLYPEHSYADDGLVLAANALIGAGDVDGGRALLRQAIASYPEGDMVPEAAFKLGFRLYQEGDSDEAMAIMNRLASVPVSKDPTSVTAGRYWAARLALYPDVANPTVPDEAGRALAVEVWASLCRAQPWSFYAVLAYARLKEEAPHLAENLSPPAPAPEAAAWPLRRTWLSQPEVQRAVALLAVGLPAEAKAELATAPLATGASEMGWWMSSRAHVGDWLSAHRELRHWLRSHLPEQANPQAFALLKVAYPDHWWDDVQATAEEYRFPSRYFHGLVRVESNFDPDAISWAGARGLCQVMPTTGRNVGRWMGMKVSANDLLDTQVNLAVGARYMDFLHERFDDSPFLSAAGYNAGEHRVDQWLERFGNIPTDEFIERIPYDETRGYVKRVVGTWQAYRTVADGHPFPELSRFNHQALPASFGG